MAPVWVFDSTQREEQIAIESIIVCENASELDLILVPRHPERRSCRRSIEKAATRVIRRSPRPNEVP